MPVASPQVEDVSKRNGVDQNGSSNNKKTSPNKMKSDDNASFLRAARGGNLEKVLEYLKANTDINTCNANGLNALHLAAKEGHVAVVKELLARGAKIDAATKKGNTALHIASLAGQEEVVRLLVENGGSVNVQSQNGFTPLYMAAQENHDGVVRFLLASGANQSLATEDGFTPLAVALQQGHDKVVAVLLENDTRGKVRLPALHIAAKKDDTKAAGLLLQSGDHNPDVTSKSGFTPLHIAAHYGNENIAALLLQRNANVNYAAKHNITPLHVAAKWGKANMVSLLLDKGANLESKTRDGLTPLHCAARSGHENVVDMMLQRGAPISAKTKNGLAPLHMASQGDHVDAARILLHHKAPVDEVTVDYLTALHVAAHCGHVRVAKLLLDRKADPNARALNGFTPLHIACKKNRIKVVELLLKYGASIEATTESGLTPLHVASFMGCMNIVIFLIQNQASPDEATVRGETPLHLAARANQTDIIRILLRNGAKVDARAREQQTPLHIASRLGNVDIVVLLLQSGAQVDANTKDLYTALHIAAKEGQEEVASVLMDHKASLVSMTKKGFTPLHLAAKYGNLKVSNLILERNSTPAVVDAEGKNGVTPLHVAAHYDHQNVALLLLDKGASPHAAAKNGYTPLHITAKKNQLDIATSLLEYGAKTDAESKAGFTPLHLASQEGHVDMTNLLLKNGADPNAKAKNGLAPIHLCAQEDRVNVAAILAANGADMDAETKAGYTPLHVACHFGSINMVRFLLEREVKVDVQNELGYTPLHQAAQQGHTQIVNMLLENNASPNTLSINGQTALSIAQRLGYISVVETLKVVTEKEITTTTTTTIEEKYKVNAPESMQETFMSDSEDEGGYDILDSAVYGNQMTDAQALSDYEGQTLNSTSDENMIGEHSYKYLTVDEMKSLGDDSMPIDVTHDEKQHRETQGQPPISISAALAGPPGSIEEKLVALEKSRDYKNSINEKYLESDNVDLPTKHPVNIGSMGTLSVATSVGNRSVTSMWRERFLVSFMVDARGGAMRGCRHSGVRVIIPPRKAPMPMRITCRYLKKDKLIHPPPMMEGEAIASRILELGPSGAKFLGPVIIEVPHFAALRGKEREIVILRSDNGETWKEHTLEATEDAVQEVLQESFDADELSQLEDLNTNRITRILTTDFPQYFAIVSRIRQEVHAIGPEGGVVNSTVVPQVQAVFPQGALTKKIKVGLQAHPIPPELTAKLLGNRVAVSPIVTVEPRRRKFHKPITLTIPVPQAAGKGMINQYNGETPTLRLLCSITGGTTRAQWEDVTGSTPLTFVNDCVNFTTTVSARFWLMDCRNISEATKMATELYREAIHVPFMAKFVVFAKRHESLEARLRVFCMTDDKEDKTLEHQEHFTEVAKSRDVEVLEGKSHFIEFGGNLVPVTKSGDQLSLRFYAFRENRLPFNVKVKDPHSEALGRIAFMREPKSGRQDAPQTPICNLNVALPDNITPEPAVPSEVDVEAIQNKYTFLREAGYGKFDTIHRADLRISDIGNLLGPDWVRVAHELGVADSDINIIKSEYPDNNGQQAMVMLRFWLNMEGNRATGNALERALRKCDREDIVNKCIFNVELVTDEMEQSAAKAALAPDQSGFDSLKEELGPSRESTLPRQQALSEKDSDVDDVDIEGGKLAAEERITEKMTFQHQQQYETVSESSEKLISSSPIEDSKEAFYEREEQKYLAEEKSFYRKETEDQKRSEFIESRTTSVITEIKDGEILKRQEDTVHEKLENRYHEHLEEEEERKEVGDEVTEKFQQSRLEETYLETQKEEISHIIKKDELIIQDDLDQESEKEVEVAEKDIPEPTIESKPQPEVEIEPRQTVFEPKPQPEVEIEPRQAVFEIQQAEEHEITEEEIHETLEVIDDEDSHKSIEDQPKHEAVDHKSFDEVDKTEPKQEDSKTDLSDREDDTESKDPTDQISKSELEESDTEADKISQSDEPESHSELEKRIESELIPVGEVSIEEAVIHTKKSTATHDAASPKRAETPEQETKQAESPVKETKEVVEEEREEVVEDILEEVIIKRRRAEQTESQVDDQELTQEDNILKVEQALEQEISESEELFSERVSPVKKEDLHAEPDILEEVEEDIIEEVIVKKKRDAPESTSKDSDEESEKEESSQPSQPTEVEIRLHEVPDRLADSDEEALELQNQQHQIERDHYSHVKEEEPPVLFHREPVHETFEEDEILEEAVDFSDHHEMPPHSDSKPEAGSMRTPPPSPLSPPVASQIEANIVERAFFHEQLSEEQDASSRVEAAAVVPGHSTQKIDSSKDSSEDEAKRISSGIEEKISHDESTTVGFVSVEPDINFANIKSYTESEYVQFGGVTSLEDTFLHESPIFKKKSTTTFVEKHKVVMLVQEQEASPTDSPQTSSGLWSDTGISLGDISNKPQCLDLQDESIGTDIDMSEMSPMNVEDVLEQDVDVTSQHSQLLSGSSESPKLSTEVEASIKETVDFGTSPVKQEQITVASSPITWDKTIVEDKGTDPVVQRIITCDVKLSPILFTESKGTSPMSSQGETPCMVDASSSPPKRIVQSASTSPPGIFDYHSRTFQKRDTSHQSEGFEFDMDLDSPIQTNSDKTIQSVSESLASRMVSHTDQVKVYPEEFKLLSEKKECQKSEYLEQQQDHDQHTSTAEIVDKKLQEKSSENNENQIQKQEYLEDQPDHEYHALTTKVEDIKLQDVSSENKDKEIFELEEAQKQEYFEKQQSIESAIEVVETKLQEMSTEKEEKKKGELKESQKEEYFDEQQNPEYHSISAKDAETKLQVISDNLEKSPKEDDSELPQDLEVHASTTKVGKTTSQEQWSEIKYEEIDTNKNEILDEDQDHEYYNLTKEVAESKLQEMSSENKENQIQKQEYLEDQPDHEYHALTTKVEDTKLQDVSSENKDKEIVELEEPQKQEYLEEQQNEESTIEVVLTKLQEMSTEKEEHKKDELYETSTEEYLKEESQYHLYTNKAEESTFQKMTTENKTTEIDILKEPQAEECLKEQQTTEGVETKKQEMSNKSEENEKGELEESPNEEYFAEHPITTQAVESNLQELTYKLKEINEPQKQEFLEEQQVHNSTAEVVETKLQDIFTENKEKEIYETEESPKEKYLEDQPDHEYHTTTANVAETNLQEISEDLEESPKQLYLEEQQEHENHVSAIEVVESKLPEMQLEQKEKVIDEFKQVEEQAEEFTTLITNLELETQTLPDQELPRMVSEKETEDNDQTVNTSLDIHSLTTPDNNKEVEVSYLANNEVEEMINAEIIIFSEDQTFREPSQIPNEQDCFKLKDTVNIDIEKPKEKFDMDISAKSSEPIKEETDQMSDKLAPLPYLEEQGKNEVIDPPLNVQKDLKNIPEQEECFSYVEHDQILPEDNVLEEPAQDASIEQSNTSEETITVKESSDIISVSIQEEFEHITFENTGKNAQKVREEINKEAEVCEEELDQIHVQHKNIASDIEHQMETLENNQENMSKIEILTLENFQTQDNIEPLVDDESTVKNTALCKSSVQDEKEEDDEFKNKKEDSKFVKNQEDFQKNQDEITKEMQDTIMFHKDKEEDLQKADHKEDKSSEEPKYDIEELEQSNFFLAQLQVENKEHIYSETEIVSVSDEVHEEISDSIHSESNIGQNLLELKEEDRKAELKPEESYGTIIENKQKESFVFQTNFAEQTLELEIVHLEKDKNDDTETPKDLPENLEIVNVIESATLCLGQAQSLPTNTNEIANDLVVEDLAHEDKNIEMDEVLQDLEPEDNEKVTDEVLQDMTPKDNEKVTDEVFQKQDELLEPSDKCSDINLVETPKTTQESNEFPIIEEDVKEKVHTELEFKNESVISETPIKEITSMDLSTPDEESNNSNAIQSALESENLIPETQSEENNEPETENISKSVSFNQEVLFVHEDKSEESDDFFQVRVSEISGRLGREESYDSCKQHDSKSDEIDELLLLVMPPGHARLNVEDQDESEFDQVNAPRIIVTPTLDDYSDYQESLPDELDTKPSSVTNEFVTDTNNLSVPNSPSTEFTMKDLIEPAIQCSVIYSQQFWGEDKEQEEIKKSCETEEVQEDDLVTFDAKSNTAEKLPKMEEEFDLIIEEESTTFKTETPIQLGDELAKPGNIEKLDKDSNGSLKDSKNSIEDTSDEVYFKTQDENTKLHKDSSNEEYHCLLTETEDLMENKCEKEEFGKLDHLEIIEGEIIEIEENKFGMQEASSLETHGQERDEECNSSEENKILGMKDASPNKFENHTEREVLITKTENQDENDEVTIEGIVEENDDDEFPNLCMLARSLRQSVSHKDQFEMDINNLTESLDVTLKDTSPETTEQIEKDDNDLLTKRQEFKLYHIQESQSSQILGRPSSVEPLEEEYESGYEMTAGREMKSFDDSTIMEQSFDIFPSEKTDSLLQESTLHESLSMEKTVSEPTLEPDLPSDAIDEMEDEDPILQLQAQPMYSLYTMAGETPAVENYSESSLLDDLVVEKLLCTEKKSSTENLIIDHENQNILEVSHEEDKCGETNVTLKESYKTETLAGEFSTHKTERQDSYDEDKTLKDDNEITSQVQTEEVGNTSVDHKQLFISEKIKPIEQHEEPLVEASEIEEKRYTVLSSEQEIFEIENLNQESEFLKKEKVDNEDELDILDVNDKFVNENENSTQLKDELIDKTASVAEFITSDEIQTAESKKEYVYDSHQGDIKEVELHNENVASLKIKLVETTQEQLEIEIQVSDQCSQEIVESQSITSEVEEVLEENVIESKETLALQQSMEKDIDEMDVCDKEHDAIIEGDNSQVKVLLKLSGETPESEIKQIPMSGHIESQLQSEKSQHFEEIPPSTEEKTQIEMLNEPEQEEVHGHSKTISFTKQLETQVLIPAQAVSETIELLPIISWNLTADQTEYPKMPYLINRHEPCEVLEEEESRPSTDQCFSPGQDSFTPSSRCSERSGTQSSIELHTSSSKSEASESKSSKASSEMEGTRSVLTSSDLSSSRMTSPGESQTRESISSASYSSKEVGESSSISSQATPESQSSSSRLTDSQSTSSKETSASKSISASVTEAESSVSNGLNTVSSATSNDAVSKSEIASTKSTESRSMSSQVSSSVVNESHYEEVEESRTSTSPADFEKSQSNSNEPSMSAHSLPSSPRRLRRAHSSGVKKITSEIFSTESDITRSLEIVYTEPSENSRRKLSEKYRHTSSNGASDGSISNEVQKIEKRKPSVTLIKKRSEQELERSKTHSESSSQSHSSSDIEDGVEGGTGVDEPLTEKKHPSPTKLKEPVTLSKPNLTSEDIIAPVLEVVCQTPERSQKHLFKYVEDESQTDGERDEEAPKAETSHSSSPEIFEDLSVEYLGGLQGASLIDEFHNSHLMRRQRSDLSDNFKISCSPEAESYFKRKAEALYEKACRGELDVEVHSFKHEKEGLKVLPIFGSDRLEDLGEVEVTDLTEVPTLEVKPVRQPFQKSSYESLYDAAKLENVYSSESQDLVLRGQDIVGDRFQGTFERPKAASSFEKLYCETSDGDMPWGQHQGALLIGSSDEDEDSERNKKAKKKKNESDA